MKTCTILGTEIAVTTMEETVRYIEEHMEELRGKYICVSNVHTTVTAYEDESYRKVQNGAAFALPDGKPLSLYSKKHGFPEAERVTGPDLMGGTLREKLPKEYPHLKIAGMVSPPYRPLTKEEDAAQVEAMNASGADIIWIGLGAPKQERYMYEHQGLTQGVMVGVGAGFDYYAGTIRRAPMWMQKLSLEWLYRLMQDPKRLFKRYFVTNFKFLRLTLGRGKKSRGEKKS